MFIIGEKINTINPRVRRAVEQRDSLYIRDLAVAQARAGADVIDVNVGSHPSVEPDNMRWAVEVIQDAVRLPLAVDSPHPQTVCVGLQACRDREHAWANSVTLDEARLEAILPAVAEYGCGVIGLCLDGHRVPPTVAARLEVAKRLLDEMERWGVLLDRLLLDVLVQPVSVEPLAAQVSLQTVQAIRADLPGIKTVICLSAVSFGLPARRLLNGIFLSLLLHVGVDAIFLDPLDSQLMVTLKSAHAILGYDDRDRGYITAASR